MKVWILGLSALLILGVALANWKVDAVADDGGKAIDAVKPENKATAIFAGGCFWCVETDFEHCPGVVDVVSGYSGGTTANPNYQNYHNGHHIEVVQVTYDNSKVTYAGLVEWLVKHIDPTDGGGSFYDRGDGYKPAVFYEDDEQKAAAKGVFEAVQNTGKFSKPLQVSLLSRTAFTPAEDYHQNYHKTTPGRYNSYRAGSGRDRFARQIWGADLDRLQFPGAYPAGVVAKSGEVIAK